MNLNSALRNRERAQPAPTSRTTRATTITSTVTPSRRRSVRHLENLLHYLANGAQGIQLAPLHLVQQPSQLRIVLDRPLEVRLRAPGRDREHLTCQILSTPLVEQAFRIEMRAVSLDLLPQLIDVLPAERLGQHDRRAPRALAVEREDRPDLV